METATYGSEFFFVSTCVEQIIDMRKTIWYLDLPLYQNIYMFGDKKYVIESAIHPRSKLHKRHTDLSFNQVREDNASNMVAFYHVYRGDNLAYIISNHWSCRAPSSIRLYY